MKIGSFLTRHGMSPLQVDIPLTCERFLGDMTAGLAGAPSSLLMLPTYLTHEGPLPLHVPVAVIDVGGTNARVAKVTFTEEAPLVEALAEFPMPGSREPISCDAFFDILAEKLLVFVRDCACIGFCFSFPARITPERDGEILYFDKEVRITDASGRMLMQGLFQTLQKKGVPNIRGVVLNDTAAALLGGVIQYPSAAQAGVFSLIYGTGINICYPEPVHNLSSLSEHRAGTMLINTESGCFDRVLPGDFDRELDAASLDPGRNLYEKMVSGAYLGELIRLTIVGAANEGLLPARFTTLRLLSTPQADAFAADPTGDSPLASLCQTGMERQMVCQIIDQLSLRAARLVCANLAATLIRADLGKHAEQPACIVVEGSTFSKGNLVRPHLETAMETYIRRRLGRHYTLLQVENANLIGSAAAALLNR